MNEVCLRQCVLLLQGLAELTILAQQGVKLHQVFFNHLCVLLQLRLLTVLYFNLTWLEGVVCRMYE